MKIQYLGTAAAEAIPGLFCSCETCREAREKKGRYVRTRSQLLIDDTLLIDFGPDTYMHALNFGVDLPNIENLLITHIHADHFTATELLYRLAGFAHTDTPTLTVHGSRDVLDCLEARVYGDGSFANQNRVAFKTLEPYVTVAVGGYEVTPLPAQHGTLHPYVYHISDGERRFLLLNDTGRPTPELMEWLKKNGGELDCVSFDCTYGYENVLAKFGVADHHMGLIDNAEVRDELGAEGILKDGAVCVATHFSHNGKDAGYGKMLEHTDRLGFLLAYDGMTVEI